MPALNKLYEQYQDRAAFYVVYIREAHASDSWQLPVNERESVVYATPKTYEERVNIAEACVRKLAIRIPALIDDYSNSTEAAYTGWPDRLYLVDRDGRVAWKSKAGPYGFEPSELEGELKKLPASVAPAANAPPA